MNSELEFDMTAEEIEDIFNRPATPMKVQAMRHSTWRIYKRLSRNQVRVISCCQRQLNYHFGRAEAQRYMDYKEIHDARGHQYWLRYQMERTPYVDDYCLLADAQRWLEKHPGQGGS